MTRTNVLGRRDLLRLGALALPTGILAGCGEPPVTAPPHIVLIVADGMGWGDVQCYTPSSSIPTPAIDRLAAEGLRFTDAHASSSEGTSSRYGILTGRYGLRSNHRYNTLPGDAPAIIEPERLTLPSLLRQAGYATAGIGTWQLGLGTDEHTNFSQPFHPAPTDYGFDSYYGIPAALEHAPYIYIENDHAVDTPESELAESPAPARYAAGPAAPGFDHREVLTNLTGGVVDVIDRHTGNAPDSPLFLYCALTAPNTPWMPSAAFEGQSGIGPYGDMVMQTDDAVKQVLAALERNGMADHTLVIFTSATGADERFLPPGTGHDPNGHWRGQRGDNWEGGHRVPLVMRWPGNTTPGTTSSETVCLTDFMATFAGICGIALPDDAGEDSFDLTPVLSETSYEQPIRPYTVHQSYMGTIAVRKGDWKMIAHQGSGGFGYDTLIDNLRIGQPGGQMYNLADDPGETENLYEVALTAMMELGPLVYEMRSSGRTRPISK